MRMISFSMTLDSFSDGSKDVTRRFWKKAWVKPGDRMMAVEKAQGLGKGGHIKTLGQIRIEVIEPEPLDEIIRRPERHDGINEPELRFVRDYPPMRPETAREGFPAFSPEQFVEMFCKIHKCKSTATVYRIVFEHIKEGTT